MLTFRFLFQQVHYIRQEQEEGEKEEEEEEEEGGNEKHTDRHTPLG